VPVRVVPGLTVLCGAEDSLGDRGVELSVGGAGECGTSLGLILRLRPLALPLGEGGEDRDREAGSRPFSNEEDRPTCAKNLLRMLF
jgi:hypothetical protein